MIILPSGFDDDGHYKAIEAPRPSREDGTGTAGLPGKVISFYIVPLDPAYRAGLAGHVPINLTEKGGSKHAHV